MQPSFQDDPLTSLSIATIYKLKISDPQIDLSAKLFRECEAMIHHIADRGLPVDEAVEAHFSLLSVGIKQRNSIPLSALMQLHGELAKRIQPALPATIEMMLNDARRHPFWTVLAPIAAIRRLIMFAGAATLFFCLILVFGGLTSAEISRSILDVGNGPIASKARQQTGLLEAGRGTSGETGQETAIGAGLTSGELAKPSAQTVQPASRQISFFDSTEGKRLILTAYFLLLSGIGAAFAALYDARRYLITGTFDPRAANYTIRLMLGLIAGLLLSQMLSEPHSATLLAEGTGTPAEAEAQRAAETANMITSLSKSLLALVGGFAAQFVYKALKRLVDALESIFDPNAALQASLQTLQRQAADQQAEIEQVKEQNQQITKLSGRIASAETDSERKQLETALMSTVMQGAKTSSAAPAVSDQEVASAQKRLDDLEAEIETKAELVLLMEAEEAAKAQQDVDGWRARLRALRAKGREIVNAENIAAVAALASAVGLFNPLGLVVGAGSKVVTSVLGARAARHVPNLLRIMVAASQTLDDDTYRRWKDILLGQRHASTSLAITERLVKRARALIGRLPIIGGLVRRLREKNNLSEEAMLKALLEDLVATARADALTKLQTEFDLSSADAGELVDLLTSHLAAQSELGEAMSDRLAEQTQGTIDEPIDVLIQLARQAIETGEAGQSLVERLLQIADLVADDSSALTKEAVEAALHQAQLS